MLMIRLQRIGRKHDPHFRIVVIEKQRGPKSGKFTEIVGSYNPKSSEVQLKEDRIKYWVSVGAQLSGTVNNFLVNKGVIKGKKVDVKPKKKKKKEAAVPSGDKEKTPETAKEEKTDAPIEEKETPVSEEKTEEPQTLEEKKEEPKTEEKKEEAPAKLKTEEEK